ncbi:photosystem I protein M (PsaM) [Allofrancisella guangzhouensis]|uniref:Photosystem I protein M (PsaM) n=1 Tax=Allofrancisella guangzhouensis TaxID=594679 RepID=A0A0A8E3Z4_9GAMM|nr:photosystem I protein M (PsaM) [Allofrancisella guangzhouensis]AJC48649.1 photosystem I protein M (PsaM) [Allofrancisella guangzhouensis]MBK2044758.1 photosystem I protein M (PsaM) [Allofrancisella guangzhouensis]MBK2045872.1 photosystem I protein M (PsaM) [Allofrancisella guangzhouensis]
MDAKRKIAKLEGLTLVELLVSTAIAMIVFSMVITIYYTVRTKYDYFKDKISTEVKDLTVKRTLYDFIKNTGFACKFGYTSQTYYDKTGDSLDSFFLGNSGLRVGPLPLPNSSNIKSSLGDGCTSNCYQAATDYIMVRKEDSHTKLADTNNLSTILKLDSLNNLAVDGYIALCNKSYVNLTKVVSINSETNTVELAFAPNSIYYPGDYAGVYRLEILYIKNTGNQDKDGNDIYSLYVYIKTNSSSGNTYELVRGVKDLQVEYATVNSGNITWNSVSTHMDITSSDYPALRVSFTS